MSSSLVRRQNSFSRRVLDQLEIIHNTTTKAKGIYASKRKASHEEIERMENALNTKMDKTILMLGLRNGDLIHPAGSNRFYINLSGVQLESRRKAA